MSSTQRVALNCTLTYLNGSNISPIANQQVTLTNRQGQAATVYNAITGGSTVSSVVTDATGNLNGSTNAYFVVEGSYIIEVPGTANYAAFNIYFEAVHGDGVGNLDPSVGVLTGDVSGTLPSTTVDKVLGGQTPVSQSTALGGDLSGTLPNPTVATVDGRAGPQPGDLVWSMAASRPGCILADGTSYNLSQHPELNNLAANVPSIVSNGVLTIPDMRSRGVIGADTSGGALPAGLTARTLLELLGEETITLTAAQSGLPSHVHNNTLNDPKHSHTQTFQDGFSSTGFGTAGPSGNAAVPNWAASTTQESLTRITINNASAGGTSASQSHDNMQPSIALNPFIVY